MSVSSSRRVEVTIYGSNQTIMTIESSSTEVEFTVETEWGGRGYDDPQFIRFSIPADELYDFKAQVAAL